MALRRSFAAGLASIVVAAAMAGAVPGNAVADTGGTPTEVATLPAPQLAPFQPLVPVVAGATGYLHQLQTSGDYAWTDYATGTDTPQPQLSGVAQNAAHFTSAGGDFVAYQSGLKLLVGNPAAGTPWITYTLPQIGTANTVVMGVGVDGTRAIVSAGGQAHLFQLNADGTVTEVAISGLPAAPGYTTYVNGFQGPDDVVVLRSVPAAGASGTASLSLLKLDTATAYPVPSTVPAAMGASVMGGHLMVPVAGGYDAFSVDDVLAGTATTPVTVAAPPSSVGSVVDYTVVGQQVLFLIRSGYPSSLALSAQPLAGGPLVQLDAVVSQSTSAWTRLTHMFVEGAGGVLLVGGTADSQAVQRLTTAADGSVNVYALRPVPSLGQRTVTLSMVSGNVRQMIEFPQVNGGTAFSDVATRLSGVNKAGKTGFGPVLQPGPCAPDASCVRETDGNQYGAVQVTTTGNSAKVSIGSSFQRTFSSPDTQVVDGDVEFVLIDSAGKQYLWDPGYGNLITLGDAGAAALWMATLWRASGPGQIQASTPMSGQVTTPVAHRTISTGVSCTPDEIQVTQHWLYWSCSATGQAEVYDLTTDAEFTVGGGPALLGDGYLVRHDAATGELRMTDVHADGVGATTVLATFPQAAGVTDDRRISWTVDRQSGDVAYAGADNVVHVLTTGVPLSAVTANVATSGASTEPGNVWSLGLVASRALADWKLVISRASTGQVVYTYDGGATLNQNEGWASWNAILQAGTPVLNGTYTWQLVTTPADAPTGPASVTATGAIQVDFARMPFHSYGSDGRSTLLAVLKPSASGYSLGRTYTGSGSGGYNSMVANTQWRLGSGSGQLNAVVPFGDMTGEGYNDLIVRTGSGLLEYYPNTVGGDLYNNTTPVVVGGGWNIYTKLVSVGDVTGDGHDDLLARDTTGWLWLYPGTGKGFFAHRVALGGGWNAYTQIVGVGDVNGDGNGDLIAVDGVGSLWRYFGNGKGSFTARVRIGSGFQAYTAIVAQGDMNGHGLNSFVARDTAGVLWRYDFTATGTLSARVRLSSGWNAFIGLY